MYTLIYPSASLDDFSVVESEGSLHDVRVPPSLFADARLVVAITRGSYTDGAFAVACRATHSCFVPFPSLNDRHSDHLAHIRRLALLDDAAIATLSTSANGVVKDVNGDGEPPLAAVLRPYARLLRRGDVRRLRKAFSTVSSRRNCDDGDRDRRVSSAAGAKASAVDAAEGAYLGF
jgi:hypothetical protein